jgi:hypothetical protein
MLESGMDKSRVDGIITGCTWVLAGHNAFLTDDVATILWRQPNTFEAWARTTWQPR